MKPRVSKLDGHWFAFLSEGAGIYERLVVRSFRTWLDAIEFALYPWA